MCVAQTAKRRRRQCRMDPRHKVKTPIRLRDVRDLPVKYNKSKVKVKVKVKVKAKVKKK